MQADLNIRLKHMSESSRKHAYIFDPLKPHFYTVKLGFIGVYIDFLISALKHRLWVLVRTVSSGGSNKYSQSMFWAEIRKLLKFFIFFGGKILNIFS